MARQSQRSGVARHIEDALSERFPMTPTPPHAARSEGSPSERIPRLPLIELAQMTNDQRRVADELTKGPRKGVVGPFVPLLYAPQLLEVVEPLGSELRFRGELGRRVHELSVCFIAATTKNAFEWDIHSQLALTLGVTADQIEALRHGLLPTDLPEDELAALHFVDQLLASNDVDDEVYAKALEFLGAAGVVELTTVVGYFILVCWLINVARSSSTWD